MGSPAAKVEVKRLTRECEGEFDRIHCDPHGWCQCVAWWVPHWDGWGERSAEQNRELRRELFARNVHDGYLIYASNELAGWCQAAKRNAFSKIGRQFNLPPDDDVWMIGCLLILPEFRNRGVAQGALQAIISDLRLRGATCVDVFPKRGAVDASELWNGPESTYLALGFVVVRNDPVRPVLRLSL
jgi:GNAT superfamily N-acetyltransferase